MNKADRRLFLGASDAAAVMGLSPWSTPVELWQEKTGRRPDEVPSARQQRIFDRGHRLEPFIRDITVDKLQDMGLSVKLIASNARYTDSEYVWMSCEIDFELQLTGEVEINGDVVQFQNERINADAKSVSGFASKKWGEVGSDNVPIEYACQFQVGLMVTGRRYCLVAALRSFDDVDIYWTVRDDETVDAMRPKLVDFWVNHVQADAPPDPMKFSDIKALFPLDNGIGIEATDEVLEWVAQLRRCKDQIADLKKTEEILSFDIAGFISPFARLTHRGRDVMTWRGQGATNLNLEALREAHPAIAAEFTVTKTNRVLRFGRPKKGSIR